MKYNIMYEYLLLTNPQAAVSKKVTFEKRYYFNQFGAYPAISGKPHITLADFLQKDMYEEKIVKELEGFASMFCPFKAKLKNYGAFKSHTIFINVEEKRLFKKVGTEIRKRVHKYTGYHNLLTPLFVTIPHMTIARQLTKEQFDNSRREYAEKEFEDNFYSDEIILLKRPIDGDGKYALVKKFKLTGPPNISFEITQLKLF